jgi:hypothetical protein
LGFYDLYRRQTNSTISNSDLAISEIQEAILDDFTSLANYHKIPINNIDTEVQIVSTSNLNIFDILSKPNETLNTGDLVYWLDNNWLITDVSADNTVYTKGKLESCNNQMNVYKNNILYQIPCILGNKLSDDDFNNTKIITTLKGDIIATVQANSITSGFKENDRFIFNGRAYKIKSVNNFLNTSTTINSNKLIYFGLDVDVISDSDDLTNNIADGLNITPISITGNRISPTTESILQGASQTFTVKKYVNNVANTNTFTITASGVPSANYTLNVINGNSFTITNNLLYTTNKLHILCTNNVDSSTVSIDIMLRGVW